MGIRYDVSTDDLVAFHLFHQTTPEVRQANRRILGIGFAIIWLGLFIVWFSLPLPLRLGASFASGLLAMGFAWKLRSWRLRNVMRKMVSGDKGRGILGSQTLEILPDGLLKRSEWSEAKYAWGMISRIESTDRHTFVMLGPNMGFVIPHYAITEGNLSLFRKTLGERYPSGERLLSPDAST